MPQAVSCKSQVSNLNTDTEQSKIFILGILLWYFLSAVEQKLIQFNNDLWKGEKKASNQASSYSR